MSETEQNLEEFLFEAALEKDTPAERDAFLEGVCRDNPTLRSRLDVLLEGHFRAEGFLSQAPERETPPSATPPVEEPTEQTIGRYKLLEKLGEGGFGEVWMAEQREPVKRRVALKIIKLGMDSKQVVARFEAERQALAMMDHANIARIFDAGTTDTGRPYFVMELVRGIKITEYCDQAQLPTRERLDLFIKVCQAIQHAHQKGIIHRDIKPSNILITLHDGVPVPKVIDFGIAKATQQELTDKTMFTQFRQFIGTPAYISPEQAEMSGLDIDTRADIYSLGVLLYELLVGWTPFDPKEMMKEGIDTLRKIIREKEPTRPSTKLNTLPGKDRTTAGKRRRTDAGHLFHQLRGDLDWIVMKCLEKDRTRRYETANGLAMDIQRHLANEPIVARPPSVAYKFQKAWKRNKLAFSAAALIAGLLAVGGTTSTILAIKARRAQRAEAAQKVVAQTRQEEAEQARQRAEQSEAHAQQLLYGANLNLIPVAFEQDNFPNARHLLDETSTYPDRGFEWYYWQKQMHREVLDFRGHTSEIAALAFSPDGRWVISFENPEDDSSVGKLWDRATGEERFTFEATGRISTLDVSPDGSKFLINNEDARWWSGPLNKLLIYSVESGKKLAEYPLLRSGSFSPDGKWIAALDDDFVYRIDVTGLDDPTGKGRKQPFCDLTGYQPPPVVGEGVELTTPRFAWCRFSSDGKSLATGIYIANLHPGGADQVIVRDAVTGRQTGDTLIYRGPPALAISPDGHQVGSTTWGKLNIASVVPDQVSTGVPAFRVNALAYSPEGEYLLTGSDDLTGRLLDAQTLEEVRRLRGHLQPITAVAYSPDGRWMATGDQSGEVRIWNAGIQPDPFTIATDSAGSGFADADISPEGHWILTANAGTNLATLWDVTTRSDTRTFRMGSGFNAQQVSFSPNGRRVLAVGDNGTMRALWVFSTVSGERLFSLLDGLSAGYWVNSARFSPDGRHIVTALKERYANAGVVRIWNADIGESERVLDLGTEPVLDVMYSPDGTRLVSISRPSGIRVWDPVSGSQIAQHKTDVAGDITFSPDGERFAVLLADNAVGVFNAETLEEEIVLRGHKDVINSVTFSPDGRRLLTASMDRTAKLWDAGTGRELLTLKGLSRWGNHAVFFPDGRRILTSGSKKGLAIWEAATDHQVEVWEREEQAHADLVQAQSAEKQRLATEAADAAAKAAAIRAKDPLAIKQWLVLAPIHYEGTSGTAALDREQIPNEAALRPRVGQQVAATNVDLAWMAVKQDDYEVDFRRLLSVDTKNSVAYAVTYVRADTARTNLLLKIGSDDQAKIYLNGEEVYRWVQPRSWRADQDTVTGVALQAGINVLVFKVVNEVAAWAGSVRITDADGNPVPGVSVTLDPDEER